VILRVERTYQAFFRRIKNGEKPGFPRFKGKKWYDSFTYPDHAGWKLEGDRLRLTNIGTVKVKMHRPLIGKIKTVTIKREVDQWYAVVRRFGACFDCSRGAEGRGQITL